jgi:branched-chain amino acid transport system permease protein
VAASARILTSHRQHLRVLPRRPGRWAWLAVGVAAVLYVPTLVEDRTLLGYGLTNDQLLGIGMGDVNFALIAILGAVALNLLVGYTGLLSMGHAAFLAMGALASGVVGVQWGLPFPVAVLAAGLVGAVIGVVVGLPSLRVRGLYLLLSTLALHFIVLYLFLRYQLASFGPAGIPYPFPELFGMTIDTDGKWYLLLLAVVAATLLLVRNMLRTREGRAFVAVRDSDLAAGAAGVDVAAVKLKAFAVSSFIVSVAGALYGYYLTNASQETFTLELVIGFYAMIIIGGMGSLLGAVLGALLWSFLPPALDTLSQQVSPDAPLVGHLLTDNPDQVNLAIFGVVVILILIFRPDGLSGMWASARRSLQRWPYTT